MDDVVLEKTKLYVPLQHETKVYCKKPSGLPEPTITWQKADDQPLPKSFGIEGCCTLKKYKTKAVNTGNYTCIAKNLAGTKSSTVEIIASSELDMYFHFICFNVKFILTREGFMDGSRNF